MTYYVCSDTESAWGAYSDYAFCGTLAECQEFIAEDEDPTSLWIENDAGEVVE